MKALFDTDILIGHLRGLGAAQQEFERYDSRAISVVTWMEALAGGNPAGEKAARSLLGKFEIIQLDNRIGERAVRISRKHRI